MILNYNSWIPILDGSWIYAFNMICIQNDLHSKWYTFKMICIQNGYAFKMIMHSKWLCIQNYMHSKLFAFKMVMHSKWLALKNMCIQNVCIQNVCKQKVLHSKCLRWNPCIVKFAGKYFSVELPSTQSSKFAKPYGPFSRPPTQN